MNNEEFRRLLATPRATATSPSTSSNGFVKPALPNSLGSRARTLIPMTPRTVAGSSYSSSFAQQLAERNAGNNPASKKKRTAVPKGTKFASGYTDRAAAARTQTEQDEADDRASRIKALEEQMKLGQLEPEVFEQLRNQITGGDVGATHLVKGLDRQLLERVRRGEDVLSGDGNNRSAEKKDEALVENEDVVAEDMDDAFAALEQKDIAPVARAEIIKKDEMAPPPPVAGAKRSRNDILAELKASRKAAQEAEAEKNKLGSRFKKINDKKGKEPRVEVDEQGREVLITVDEYGRTKRKVRKVPAAPPVSSASTAKAALLVPDKMVKPLGSEVVVPEIPVAAPKPVEDDDDDDIFAGVGDSYNPLGDIPDDDDSDDSDDETAPSKPAEPEEADISMQEAPSSPPEEGEQPEDEAPPTSHDIETPVPSTTASPPSKQNYFGDTPSTDEPSASTSRLDILGVIQRAAAKHSSNETISKPAPGEPTTAAQRLLGNRDRDFDDLDMGFGSSRFGDEEDEDEGGGGKKVKLSEWRGAAGGDDDEDDAGGEGAKKKGVGAGPRKRGKKKGKGGGDKNNAADVLRVMAARGR